MGCTVILPPLGSTKLKINSQGAFIDSLYWGILWDVQCSLMICTKILPSLVASKGVLEIFHIITYCVMSSVDT